MNVIDYQWHKTTAEKKCSSFKDIRLKKEENESNEEEQKEEEDANQDEEE